MKKFALLLSICMAVSAVAQELNRIPIMWRWTGDHQVAFTHDYRNVSENDFTLDAATGKRIQGAAPASMPMMMQGFGGRPSFPFKIEGAENPTYSPDSSKIAFTRDNNLWVMDVATKKETALTNDGSDVILNGYSSWVYYEEILGREFNSFVFQKTRYYFICFIRRTIINYN